MDGSFRHRPLGLGGAGGEAVEGEWGQHDGEREQGSARRGRGRGVVGRARQEACCLLDLDASEAGDCLSCCSADSNQLRVLLPFQPGL